MVNGPTSFNLIAKQDESGIYIPLCLGNYGWGWLRLFAIGPASLWPRGQMTVADAVQQGLLK